MEALVALGPSTQGARPHPQRRRPRCGDVATQLVPDICIGRRRCCEAALAHVCRRQGGAMHALAAQVCGIEFGEDVVRDVMLAL
ncbi:MAG: hypothetical protein M3066_07825 [Actinomycetota bacterium]|nr:hypothetical protein [Actinomycetota bacterium]